MKIFIVLLLNIQMVNLQESYEFKINNPKH